MDAVRIGCLSEGLNNLGNQMTLETSLISPSIFLCLSLSLWFYIHEEAAIIRLGKTDACSSV